MQCNPRSPIRYEGLSFVKSSGEQFNSRQISNDISIHGCGSFWGYSQYGYLTARKSAREWVSNIVNGSGSFHG